MFRCIFCFIKSKQEIYLEEGLREAAGGKVITVGGVKSAP
jgi:hypothetical protein